MMSLEYREALADEFEELPRALVGLMDCLGEGVVGW